MTCLRCLSLIYLVTKHATSMQKYLWLTYCIYGLIDNIITNPKEVLLACDLLEMVIYDVHVL